MRQIRSLHVATAALLVLVTAMSALALRVDQSQERAVAATLAQAERVAPPATVDTTQRPPRPVRVRVRAPAPDQDGVAAPGGAGAQEPPRGRPEPEAAAPEPESEPEPASEAPDEGVLPPVDGEALAAVAERTGVPARALAAYAGAAMWAAEHEPGCNLDWALLAGIGRVESDHGRLGGGGIGEDGAASRAIRGPRLDGSGDTRPIRDTDGGRLDGDERWDRAVGPMQFIPGTWQRWGSDATGDGEADPHHIDDAALSAARYLCAAGDLGDADTWWRAVLSYNRSEAYARHVLAYNNHYAGLSHG